jgi:hypothetical protein
MQPQAADFNGPPGVARGKACGFRREIDAVERDRRGQAQYEKSAGKGENDLREPSSGQCLDPFNRVTVFSRPG